MHSPFIEKSMPLPIKIYAAQKRSVHTLFATAQHPHSRDIGINQKILYLDKLIKFGR